ncbi:Retrovirus-related Pol polyprotein from transposon TNT 1-94-like protein [Drosera capensis]
MEGLHIPIKDYVCKLKKSLYGLKQAPRQWYKKFESVICGQGYRKTTSNHCVFVNKFSDGNFIILLLYVDDMLIVGKDIFRIDRLKKQLGESFAMKDMEPAKQILGIRIMRDRKEKKFWLSQKHYIERVLQRFRMDNAKDWKLGLGGDKPTLLGYSKSDMAGAMDSRKSTSGRAVAWQSKLQKYLALSTTESEFIAITEACKELLWMKKFLRVLGFVQKKSRFQAFIHAVDAQLSTEGGTVTQSKVNVAEGYLGQIAMKNKDPWNEENFAEKWTNVTSVYHGWLKHMTEKNIETSWRFFLSRFMTRKAITGLFWSWMHNCLN